MSRPPSDPVALLLPDASDASRGRARRVATFLRLLSADARPRRAEVVGLDVPHVRDELERVGRERRLAWTLVLLRHHLRALRPADSFLAAPPACPDPAQALAEWTRELELAGEELPWTEPRPSACTCAEGLLRVLRGLTGPGADETLLFEACFVHLTRGPASGERRWRALLARGREPLSSLAAAGVAAALLERGRVRAARRWIRDPRRRDTELLRGLGSWAQLLETGFPSAPCNPPSIPLPLPLHELRRRVPSLEASLQGVSPATGPPRALPFEGLRESVGAVAFVVFVLVDDRALPVHWELAPRVRAGFDGFCDALRTAHRDPGAREHVLVTTGRGQVHDRPTDGWTGPTLSTRARAVACEPFGDPAGRDPAGRIRGWFHLELEHHLAPVGEQRRELARACAARARPPVRRGEGPRTRAARALARSLGRPGALRRWWVFDDGADEPVLTGGGALGHAEAPARGVAGIVRLVRAEGVPCAFEGPTPALSIHPDAGSGAAAPLVFAGRVHGVLALESERADDLDASLREQLAERALRHAPAWRAAQFAAWHRRRFARPVVFRLDGGGWRSALPVLVVAARRCEPIGVYGPGGVGRVVVARWLHFEGPGPGASLESVRGTGQEETLARITACPSGGTLVLDTAVLTRDVRAALAARLRRERDEPPGARTLLVLLARRREDLEQDWPRLVRHAVGVPPLFRRREELPALLALLREDAPLPFESLALLWRQRWPGNLPELAAFLAAARARAAGGSLGPALLREVARAEGLVLAERVPTRSADRGEVEAALAFGRRPGARANKRRAAALLGWDPATLAQHVRREGIPERGVGEG